MKQRLVVALVCLCLSGCGTFANLAAGPAIYGGVRRDLNVHRDMMSVSFAMLDVPFSLIFDTALLPATVILSLVRELTGWPPCDPELFPGNAVHPPFVTIELGTWTADKHEGMEGAIVQAWGAASRLTEAGLDQWWVSRGDGWIVLNYGQYEEFADPALAADRNRIVALVDSTGAPTFSLLKLLRK